MYLASGFILVFMAVLLGIIGFLSYRHYKFMWTWSRERRLYTDSVVPTARFVKRRKIEGVIILTLATVFLVVGIVLVIMSRVEFKALTIEGNEISLPCTYEDIQAMGYELEEGQEIVEIRGTDNSYNRNGKDYYVVNDKGQKFQIRFENSEPEDKVATECKIYKMTFEYAAPKNVYQDTLDNYYSYSYNLQTAMGLSQEEINQIMEDYRERASEFEENNKPMNSPSITLRNGVSSGMSEARVASIMGNGEGLGFTTAYYDKQRRYYMSCGEDTILVTISYVTKDKIASITLEY